MIALKAGVESKGIQPRALLIIMVVESVFRHFGLGTIVTSLLDGKHQENSWHYRGEAVDFRTKHIPSQLKKPIIEAVKGALPGFDVIFENEGKANEHLHIEPGTGGHDH